MSLLLGGALTWVLVRDLEFQGAQDQLDRGVVAATVQVKHQECFTRPAVVTNIGVATCRLDTPVDFEDRLSSIVLPTLSGNRLLLLDAKVSETTTGVKSLLLKVVDPLFKKDGGGSAIPIKIEGTRHDPKFGLDVRRIFKKGDKT